LTAIDSAPVSDRMGSILGQTNVKILLVDDSRLIRLSIKRKLAAAGYENVIEAGSGPEALTMLDGVEVVLSDFEMPEMNGHQLAKAIRESEGGQFLRLILITGHDLTPESVVVHQSHGFDAAIDKSVEPDQLKIEIEKVRHSGVPAPKVRFSHAAPTPAAPEKIKLAGFNNLTKCLSFNLYDFAIARNEEQRAEYIQYIDKKYSSKHIAKIAHGICEIIEAEVLDISTQDYDPFGASTLVLMSDIKAPTPPPGTAAVHAHLNKSHICAHTYPDTESKNGICSFRVDIDIATCGEITPMRALNYMFRSFESDVVIMDYVVRGYTRDLGGRKVYNDQPFNSIRDFIDQDILNQYQVFEDLNIPPANIWQTKVLAQDLNVEQYFMNPEDASLPDTPELIQQLRKEMREIYYMHQV
jgi:S-adenosylmethionine decarboxylase